MKRIVSILLSLICALLLLSAQETKSNIDWEFTPTIKLDGVFKSRYEYATKTNTSRFSVRSSRLAIEGDVTPFITYRTMVELSNNGTFSILDLYAAIKPIDRVTIKVGQSVIPILNGYAINPAKTIFANRPFIWKYFTLGTRDLGVSGTYDFTINDFPVAIDGAIFNGNTLNEPLWTDKLSFATRLRIGNKQGFRTTAKLYKLPKNDLLDFMIYGADLRYEASNWKVETEIMHRKNKVNDDKLIGAYLQGAYWFPLRNGKLFKKMIHTARWDAMGSSQTDNTIDVNRLTLGLGFGFTDKLLGSLIRIDYDFYFIKNELPILNVYEEMSSNKLTIELLLIF